MDSTRTRGTTALGRRTLHGAVAALLLATGLAACGGGDSETMSGTGTPSSGSSASRSTKPHGLHERDLDAAVAACTTPDRNGACSAAKAAGTRLCTKVGSTATIDLSEDPLEATVSRQVVGGWDTVQVSCSWGGASDGYLTLITTSGGKGGANSLVDCSKDPAADDAGATCDQGTTGSLLSFPVLAGRGLSYQLRTPDWQLSTSRFYPPSAPEESSQAAVFLARTMSALGLTGSIRTAAGLEPTVRSGCPTQAEAVAAMRRADPGLVRPTPVPKAVVACEAGWAVANGRDANLGTFPQVLQFTTSWDKPETDWSTLPQLLSVPCGVVTAALKN